MGLREYHRKRDFARTPEPPGGSAARRKRSSFVIQKHAASRLHYDFRLEHDGVLKSWAVPKGPSLDPAQKRLAVEVEDHPLEYGGFEGVIPQGEYGGGSVLLWDRGTWKPAGDPGAMLQKGRLDFELEGEKLRGAWTLVRMGRRDGSGGKPQWLLMKRRDAQARGARDRDILEERPESVASGRTIDRIDPSRTWKSNRPATRRAPAAPAAARAPKSRAKAAAPAPVDPKTLPGARRAKLPEFVTPVLATLVAEVPAGDDWVHEIKFDGYRALCRVERGRARLYTRNGLDWTDRFGGVAAAAARLPARTALVDGEVVVYEPDGTTSFQSLQNAIGRDDAALVYQAFDLLHLDGWDLTGVPLTQRKAALAALVHGRDEGVVRYSDHVVGRGAEFHRVACERKLEDIIAKRAGAPYRGGRGRDWLKIKCALEQELVIGGWSDPAGSRAAFGALLLGYYAGGVLKYAGRVGTGFTHESLTDLGRRLRALETKTAPFADAPRGRGIHWAKPELVAQIAFTGWTSDRKLRHPSFRGLREDKRAREVTLEQPADTRTPPASRAKSGGRADTRTRVKTAKPPAATAARPSAVIRPTGRPEVLGVAISNPDRVLYPEVPLTKLDLARYYEVVAPRMLPEVLDRPLMTKRCPQGWSAACFFQKHPSGTIPPVLGRVQVRESKGAGTYLFVRDAAGLAALAQIGTLEIHVWGSRADRIEQPDRVVFDLDPDPAVPWDRVVALARALRERLGALGIETFVKTTGGKGLHVVAPLARRAEWPDVLGFANAIAMGLVREDPRGLTLEMSKAKRAGKILIDTLRNGRGATWVAPYSTRARAGAPVSMPVDWRELGPRLRPDGVRAADLLRDGLPKRDPWRDLAKTRQSLTATILRAAGVKR